MTPTRYYELEAGNDTDGPHLTPEEKAAGWHFCCEFDGLLVGPGMCEQQFCLCFTP